MSRDQSDDRILLGASNDVWLGDVTTLDTGITASEPLEYLRLAVIMDKASTCVMGFHLGFTSLEQAIALALRHAVLPKQYFEEYGLHFEWQTYGVPRFLTVDRFLSDSQFLRQVTTKLRITLLLEGDPSPLSMTEHFFNTLKSVVPLGNKVTSGYFAERNVALSVADLNLILVRYIVDHYNQCIHPRCSNMTRFQMWQSRLTSAPDCLQPRNLDF